MRCSNCGKESPEGSKFCVNCGTPLSSIGENQISSGGSQPSNQKNKWYLQTWFICLLFAAWPLVVPPIIGIVLLILQYKESAKLKKFYEGINSINEYKEKRRVELDTYEKGVKERCNKSESEGQERLDKLKNTSNELSSEISNLKSKLKELQNNIFDLHRDYFVQSIVPEVDDNITSEEYKNKLSMLKVEENEFLKSDTAILKILRDGNKKEILNDEKQILRCFNSESASIISNVTVKNIDTQRNRLQRTYENLNTLFTLDGVSINPKLLEYKLEELNLVYSYELKKEQEKEEQQAIREQMLEEEKVRREIEKEKGRIEKEESQFKSEISKLMEYLHKASDIEKQLYVDKITELEDKLKLLEKDKDNVFQREQNTRAGYVYVISNIGSFGENVYKIGMTRRLEPMDRIKELSSASVPFEFDVHAMIFSEDAPALETTLHTTFRNKQVNRMNDRKEFFRVSLDDIEKVVKENYNATVTFTKAAEAFQYRETLKMIDAENKNVVA